MAGDSGFAAFRSALGNRNFRLYVSGNVVSYIGTWVQRVAVGWLTWELTKSGLWLGIVAMADLAPGVLIAPVAGAVADRVDRIRAIKITQSLMLLQAAALAVLTWTGNITIGLVVALTLALGVINAFNQPVRMAVVPSFVGRRDLAAAIGINSLTYNGSRIIGPAIAGGVIVYSGVAACFALNALSYIAAIAALFMMSGNPQDRPEKVRPIGNLRNEIAEGFTYCMRHPGIAPLLVMVTFVAVLGRAYMELLPGFAGEVFGRGADGLAVLTSSMGVGAVVAGIVLAGRGRVEGLTAMVLRGILLLAIALMAFTMAPSIWVGAACIAVAGYASITCSVGQQTLMQNAVAPEMRGRAMSLYGVIARAGPALGALAMGALHDDFGLRWPVFGGAALCLALGLWVFRRRQSLASGLERDPFSSPPAGPNG